uniref:Uncharacterized protein n=1 Tax=Arundo donax TaxID=35708 RepID=A0A0A8ZI62_ARUDO
MQNLRDVSLRACLRACVRPSVRRF